MGEIRKLSNNELVGGTDNKDVYPITAVKAVYDDNNVRLDNIIKKKSLVNITYYYNRGNVIEVLNLLEAIKLVPLSDRIPGFHGTFLSPNGWVTCRFEGENITTEWEDATKWYIFKGSESIEISQELGNNTSIVVSQKTITNEFNIVHNEITSIVTDIEEAHRNTNQVSQETKKDINNNLLLFNNYVNNSNLINCFERIVCIGDELVAGYTNTGYTPSEITSGVARVSARNLTGYLRKITNIDIINLGYEKTTVRDWRYSTPETSNNFHDCALDYANIKGTQAYFIMLGANDTGTEGSVDDIASDYNNNSDSFYGNYDYIVRRLHEIKPNAHIFVFALTGVNKNSTYNNVINDIASIYPEYCHYIDINDDYFFTDKIFQQVYSGSYYSPLGYNILSNVIKNAVSNYIYNKPEKFLGVPYTADTRLKGSIDIESLVLTSKKIDLSVNSYETIYAKTIPDTTSDKEIAWRITDGDPTCIDLIASKTNVFRTIKGLKAGTVTLTATDTISNCSASCIINIS